MRLELVFRVKKAITWNDAVTQNERQKGKFKYQVSTYKEEERKEGRR